MRLKLDEGLGRAAADILRASEHAVATVPDEGLTSATDREILKTCQSEARCLVTLDIEFGNPLLFKPSEYLGIAVPRLPAKATPKDLHQTLQSLAAGPAKNPIDGRLWIVQGRRIREYEEEGRGNF